MDKLEAMRVFVEVAEQQSFVKASRHLNLSAPSVTRSIALLEERLGVKLFNRTTRHVRLSESGAHFLVDAKRILDDVESAENAVSGSHQSPQGILTVTSPVFFGQKYVAPIISEYLELYPGVSVRALFYDRITNIIEEDIDVAIRIGYLKDSGLYAIPVGSVKRVVCGSPGYFKKHGMPQVPSDLSEHDIIFAEGYDPSTTWSFEQNNKKESVKLSPRLYCNQKSVAIDAALSGRGVALLMTYQIAGELQDGSLVAVLEDYENQPLPINMVHAEGRRSAAKNRLFLDLAAERLRANPWVHL